MLEEKGCNNCTLGGRLMEGVDDGGLIQVLPRVSPEVGVSCSPERVFSK